MHRILKLELRAGLLIAATLGAAPAFARGPFATDAGTPPRAIPAATDSARAPCFFRRNWRGGFRATPDARAIYIRVARSVYRLDMQASYSLLKDPFAVLSNTGSTNTICSPLDFRLSVSNRAGVMQWPIVRRMTLLTPQEAAALPKHLRP